MKTHAYKIVMSKGPEIPIDEDELEKILTAIRTGNPVVVRQGMFNPSFWVSMSEDKERVQTTQREREQIEQHNKYALPAERKEWTGMQSLRDIFAESFKRLSKPK